MGQASDTVSVYPKRAGLGAFHNQAELLSGKSFGQGEVALVDDLSAIRMEPGQLAGNVRCLCRIA